MKVQEIDPQKFIDKLKDELKKVESVKPPLWISFVKSGAHKERPPEQPDFWYIRTASILRRIYLNGPVGVERLRSYYGGRKRHKVRPPHFKKASGSVIRKILQQLEDANFIEKTKRGRKITPKGMSFLDKVAKEIK
jgi:small subunit ribosomal protein S19e